MLTHRERELEATVEDLKQGEQDIKRLNRGLNEESELRVHERTAQLCSTCRELEARVVPAADAANPLVEIVRNELQHELSESS
jgi:hypothetical protein